MADLVHDDPEPDPESVARRIVLDLLTGRARSRAELAEQLARRGVPDDVAGRVLDRLTEVGLVDDVAFATALVSSGHAAKGLSRHALAVELRRKGVAAEVAAGALETLGRDDEERAARALVDRRLPALSGLPVELRRRRLIGVLGRKGYTPGLAYRVVDAALREVDSP